MAAVSMLHGVIAAAEPSLSAAEVATLSAMTDSKGQLVLNHDKTEMLYEILSMIIDTKMGIEAAVLYFGSVPTPTDPFDLPIFKKQRDEYLGDMERARNAIEVMEGVVPCPKCTSMKTLFVIIQNRGGDEASASIISCRACNKITRS